MLHFTRKADREILKRLVFVGNAHIGLDGVNDGEFVDPVTRIKYECEYNRDGNADDYPNRCWEKEE